MFAQALEQISKKISKSKQKEQGYKILEKKIMSNPVLKAQFEVYNEIRENTQKLKPTEFKSFSNIIKEKVSKVDSTKLAKEVKGLLEYFNIDPSSVKKTVIDSAMALNENALKSIVINERKQFIAENFKGIIKKEDENSLRKNFQIIRFLSEAVRDEKTKTFIKGSLRALLEERYKDYSSCAKKLYKLRTLTEDVMDDYFDDEDDYQQKSEYGGGKKVSVKDMKYLKKISISVPDMFKKPEKIIISFQIPVYPIGATMNAARTSAIKTRERLNRLERPFINYTIYQKNRTDLFDPIGTIWDCSVRLQTSAGASEKARVDIYLNTNAETFGVKSWEDFYTTAIEMCKDFDALLPQLMGDQADVLTPAAQQASIKSVKGLPNKEKNRIARQNGQVDTDLLRRKILSKSVGEEDAIEDDFGGMF